MRAIKRSKFSKISRLCILNSDNALRFPCLVLSRASLIPFAVSEHPAWQGELRAPSTQTTCARRILVPVIYIRERNVALCSRVHSSYARAEELLKIMWPPYRAGSSHIHVSRISSVVKIFDDWTTCESCSRLSPDLMIHSWWYINKSAPLSYSFMIWHSTNYLSISFIIYTYIYIYIFYFVLILYLIYAE